VRDCMFRIWSQVERGEPFDCPWTCGKKSPHTRDEMLCPTGECPEFVEWDGTYTRDNICSLAEAIIAPLVGQMSPQELSQHWIIQALGVTMDELITRYDRILAFDASTTAVGWALRVGHTITDGIFIPDKKQDWVGRVLLIQAWALAGIQPGDCILYETASGSHGNMATNRKLGSVEFVFRAACREREAEFMPVATKQIETSGLHKNPEAAAEWLGRELNARTAKHKGDIADALGMIRWWLGIDSATKL